MMNYSKELIGCFLNARYCGVIDDADAVGTAGDLACGDFLKLWLKVDGGIVSDIKFKCFGCPAAIATSEMLCKLAHKKSIDEAYQITDEMVADGLFGLPEEKFHCSNLGSTALKNAIDAYRASGDRV